MSIEAMKLALDALESRCGTNADERLPGGAIPALRTALSQQIATPEPVAWMASYVDPIGNDHVYVTSHHDLAVENDMHGTPRPLYTRPVPSVPDGVVREAERYRFILAAADDMTTSRYKSLCELLGVAITEDFDLGAAIDAAMLAAKEGTNGEIN